MIQKKICMVGPPSVGKTSLVARYVHRVFSDKYLSTVGVRIDKKRLQLGDQELTLMLWDLAGDDDFQPLKSSYLRGAAGCLFVADGSRASSLDQVLELHQRVFQVLGPIPFVLVLNKSDLKTQWEIHETRIQAMRAQGWTVWQTSAKDGSGVEGVFTELAQMTLADPRRKTGEPNSE